MPLTQVRNYLETLTPGNLSDDQRGELESLLISCWGSLLGSEDGGMSADKLSRRTEGMEWKPPILSFSIERHGGTVLGSIKGEIQGWSIDLDRERASFTIIGHRQLRPSAKPLDVKPLANEIAALIKDGRNDDRLAWKGANKVRVEVGKIIPESFPAQTTSGRRKRFRKVLETVLAPSGWTPSKSGSHLFFERVVASPMAEVEAD